MTNHEYELLINKLPNQLRRAIKEIELNLDEVKLMKDNGEISQEQYNIYKDLMGFLSCLYFN